MACSPEHRPAREHLYKQSIFSAFKNCYEHQIDNERMIEIAKANWPKQNDQKRDQKIGMLRDIANAWNDWQFAWDNE